jgi:hypothetical protein
VSLSKSISIFRASLGENARPARRADDQNGDKYWSALVSSAASAAARGGPRPG